MQMFHFLCNCAIIKQGAGIGICLRLFFLPLSPTYTERAAKGFEYLTEYKHYTDSLEQADKECDIVKQRGEKMVYLLLQEMLEGTNESSEG